MNTSLLDRAIVFATRSHAGAARKGKNLPYIVHPLEAVAIVATLTDDQELLAAAALHDVVEDTGISLEQLRGEFGDRVASLVASDTHSSKAEASWRGRREETLARLSAASREAQMVAIGDKLSNLRAIAIDYQAVGDQLWSRFRAPNGRADVEWYYRGLAQALAALAGTPPYQEFLVHLEEVFPIEIRK